MTSLKKKQPQILTKYAFCNIEECHCGKPVFKYHNTSKNVYILKCAYVKYDYDIKTKKWPLSKKQPCALYCIYHAERPVLFKKIENTIIKITKFKEFTLEKRLRTLFSFLHVSNRTSTIQEVDLLVVNNLKREPRKIYYYPSIGHLRISHRETFKDYETRIFSEEIIDLEITPSTPSPREHLKSIFLDDLEPEPEPEPEDDQDPEENDPELEESDPEDDIISYSDPEEEIEFETEESDPEDEIEYD